MKTRIATIVMVPIVLIFAYLLFAGISEPLADSARIDRSEKAIIQKLKFIRDLQVLYQSQNGQYAGKWEKLVDFVNNGSVLNIERKEVRKEGGKEDEYVIKIDTLGRIPVKDSLKRKYASYLADIQNLALIPDTKDKRFSLFAGQVASGKTMVNVFEVKDIYPVNPARGAEFKPGTKEPYSVPTLLADFDKKLKEYTEKGEELKKKKKDAKAEEKEAVQKEIDEVSKYVNLFQKRIDRLKEKPLRVGSREEATIAGNWE